MHDDTSVPKTALLTNRWSWTERSILALGVNRRWTEKIELRRDPDTDQIGFVEKTLLFRCVCPVAFVLIAQCFIFPDRTWDNIFSKSSPAPSSKRYGNILGEDIDSHRSQVFFFFPCVYFLLKLRILSRPAYHNPVFIGKEVILPSSSDFRIQEACGIFGNQEWLQSSDHLRYRYGNPAFHGNPSGKSWSPERIGI